MYYVFALLAWVVVSMIASEFLVRRKVKKLRSKQQASLAKAFLPHQALKNQLKDVGGSFVDVVINASYTIYRFVQSVLILVAYPFLNIFITAWVLNKMEPWPEKEGLADSIRREAKPSDQDFFEGDMLSPIELENKLNEPTGLDSEVARRHFSDNED